MYMFYDDVIRSNYCYLQIQCKFYDVDVFPSHGHHDWNVFSHWARIVGSTSYWRGYSCASRQHQIQTKGKIQNTVKILLCIPSYLRTYSVSNTVIPKMYQKFKSDPYIKMKRSFNLDILQIEPNQCDAFRNTKQYCQHQITQTNQGWHVMIMLLYFVSHTFL